jgi:hypothetical protein
MVMKRLGQRLLIFAVLLGVTASFALPVAVHAEDKLGLSISPPTFEFSANPGDSISNSIRVENISDQQLPVSVDVRNFSALGEEGEVNLSKDDNSYSLSSWIKISPSTATIAPKESKTFDYTISVPTNAQPGGRFGSVVFSTSPKKVAGGTGVSIGQEVGSLIFLKIAGDVHESAQIVSFGAGGKVHEYGPVTFEARVKDAGNVQFKPRGTITITNIFGKTVETIPVDSRNVLPGAIRKMDAKWNHKWLFGPYTATTSMVYGSKGQIITASTSFWGFPFKIILAVLIVLAIAGFGIYKGRARLARTFKVLFGKE